jgi:hypothetical protein
MSLPRIARLWGETVEGGFGVGGGRTRGYESGGSGGLNTNGPEEGPLAREERYYID